MKKKKILSGILIFNFLLSTMNVPVFAADEDGKALEQAIVAAKKVITVPQSYSEFTHSSNQVERNGEKVTVWRFGWSEKDGKNGQISASVDQNGNIYQYSKFANNEDEKGLAKVTKDEAEKSAEKFLQKAIKMSVGEMKLEDDSSVVQSNTYNFEYEKFVNSVPVNFASANLQVDKYTGEVIAFNEQNTENNKAEYSNLDGKIEAAAAEKNYIDKIGVDLKYYSYYDREKKKLNVFPAYSVSDNKNKAIDGKTGQVVDVFNKSKIYNEKYNVLENDIATASAAKADLTKEESEAVNNVQGLITKEKAEEIIKGSDVVSSDMKVSDISLNKNDISQKYIWEVAFEGGYGEVDAKSGELLSAHKYETDKENMNISQSDAKNAAENFLKKITSDKFAATKYDDKDEEILKIGVQEDDEKNPISNFTFKRQVNGIEFTSNYLKVTIDRSNGKIIGYDNKWYDNVNFPGINGVMTKEAAFNKLKEYKGFLLQYAMLDKNKVGLVYNFKELNENYIIDPVSGARLDYTGKAYQEPSKLPEYTDISGVWCEKTIKELLDNGYYLDGEKFYPYVNITQVNFFKYLYSPERSGYNDDDEFYDMLIQNKIITKEEKNPSSFLSRQDAAKFIIRYLGYDKVASHPEIFKYPFKDNLDEQYKGYASMCYALNIIKGGEDGKFNGTDNINNAQAAVLIYNLVKNNPR